MDNEFYVYCKLFVLQVIVVDKPGPPIGPLTPTEITAHTVSLSWKPPQDNGGSEITGYVVEKTDANYDMWKVVPGYCPKCNFTVKVNTQFNLLHMF